MIELAHVPINDIYRELSRRIGVASRVDEADANGGSRWCRSDDEANICEPGYVPGAILVISVPLSKKDDADVGFEMYMSGNPFYLHDALPRVFLDLTEKLAGKITEITKEKEG